MPNFSTLNVRLPLSLAAKLDAAVEAERQVSLPGDASKSAVVRKALAAGRDIRANVGVLHELRKDRAAAPPEIVSPAQIQMARDAAKRREDIAQLLDKDKKLASVLTNFRERLEAKKAAAGAPVIDLEAIPTPQATPVENSPPSPVRTRSRPASHQKK